MANILTGVTIIKAVTDELNMICKTESGIRRNDPRIWDILHKLTPEEWDDIITTMEAVNTDSPGCYYPNDLSTLQETRKAFTKSTMLGKDFVGKPMVARSGNKYTVWRFTMIMREVINRYTGVYIKNQPGDIEDLQDLAKPAAAFNEIFTTD
jgi:hypothetical protein